MTMKEICEDGLDRRRRGRYCGTGLKAITDREDVSECVLRRDDGFKKLRKVRLRYPPRARRDLDLRRS